MLKAAQEEIRMYKDQLEAASSEGMHNARAKVLEMCDKLASWRRASRQGYCGLVTAPMAKIVSAVADQVKANHYEATLAIPRSELLTQASETEAFFEAVLAKGCLPEREPKWEEAQTKLRAA